MLFNLSWEDPKPSGDSLLCTGSQGAV